MYSRRSRTPEMATLKAGVLGGGAVRHSPAGARPAGSASAGPRRRKRLKLWPYAFIAVPIAAIVILEVIPTLGVVWLSFTDYNPLVDGSWHSFVGFANWKQLIHDAQAWQAFRQTLYFVALYLPASVILALLIALLLNQRVRGMAFYRGVYFLPVIVSWVAGSTMILWFIDPQSGGLALVMERLHLGSLPYLLQQPSTALPMVAATSIWKFVGYNAVIFLAGLQALNPELVDAAKVDGAGPLRRFWYVTLPELRPITTVVIVLNLVLSLRLFDPIKVMTNGGPNFSTTTLVMYYYSVSWDGLQFGYGSAITLLLTALILFGAALQFAYFRFRGGES